MVALKRLVFIFVFLERAFVRLQGFVYDDTDFRRARIGMAVVVDLQDQCRFAFLDALEVESPAAFPVDVEKLAVADFPAEGVLVVARACDFFLVFVKELYADVFAHAVRVHLEHFEASIGLAAIDAVGEFPVGPVKVPAFDFEVFVLVGRGAVVVAAGGEECAKNGTEKGNGKGLDKFHFLLVC